MNSNTEIESSRIKCCVIVPTYNNAGTLEEVLLKVLEHTGHVLVVNDGSTDETAEILARYTDRIELITFKENIGKGYALRKGFERAVGLGYSHAITIDSDGQHFPSDLPAFEEEMKSSPGSLVIGARNMESENVPGKSSFGHKFSNFWFRFETGINLDDTQSGYRLYPLHALQDLNFFTRKFEFEIEVIVKAAWAGIEVKNIPIRIHYAPGKNRVSHFRPFRDFTRISFLNTYFVILAIFYHIPVRFFKKLTYANVVFFLRKHFLNKNESTRTKALSIGFGVFMGIFPVWGYQMLLGLIVAQLLRFNKALFLVFANISIPPMIPFILYASYKFGGLFYPDSTGDLFFSNGITFDTMKQNLIQYLSGAVALATVCGILSGLLSYLFIALYRQKRRGIEA